MALARTSSQLPPSGEAERRKRSPALMSADCPLRAHICTRLPSGRPSRLAMRVCLIGTAENTGRLWRRRRNRVGPIDLRAAFPRGPAAVRGSRGRQFAPATSATRLRLELTASIWRALDCSQRARRNRWHSRGGGGGGGVDIKKTLAALSFSPRNYASALLSQTQEQGRASGRPKECGPSRAALVAVTATVVILRAAARCAPDGRRAAAQPDTTGRGA